MSNMAGTEHDALKTALKEAIKEAIDERHDALRAIVAEAIEDVGLASAIDEGMATEPVSREVVMTELTRKP